MTSIPASQLVSVQPGVLGAGGNPLSLNGVFLTTDTSIPVGEVRPFSTLQDVQDWFGASSPEALLAAVYFNGFTGASVIPGTIYFAQYNSAAVGAYVRGGSLDGMTLAQLQALSGTLVVVIDGETVTSPSIDLSSATSFSNAAALIQAGLQTAGSVFSGTATIDDGAGGAGNTLTIATVAAGAVHLGDIVAVTGGTPATITAFLTGTGGVGTYTVNGAAQLVDPAAAATVTSTAAVTYDSLREGFVIHSPTTGDDSTIAFATGTLSAGIKLTSATGAVLSQGADAAVPADFMAAVTDTTQNWATFMTVFEPLLAAKLLFADWVTTTNDRYAYVAWDTDVTALAANASGSFGALTANYNGVVPVWGPADKAAFICGTAASLNFAETNGRITFAFKGQAGLSADVTDATVANNLIGNGYNFYGSYATANQQFTFLQPGKISGEWLWIDEYINQIQLNAALQLAFMNLLTNAKSVPYNQDGYTQLRAAALDPITEALNFGTIRSGVSLSASQAVQVNTSAGARISDTLQNTGWYLSVQDAPPSVRAVRGSPPMTLWYMSGQSIQRIQLASIDIL